MSVNIVDYGVSTILGSRQDQEDRYITFSTGSFKSRKEIALFAVYDGHGGAEAVNHVASHLHTYLEQQILANQASDEAIYKLSIQQALKAVDKDLADNRSQGGSTVALILVDTKQSLLIEANLGDSHVFFADHRPQSPQSLSPASPTRTNSASSVPDEWNVEVLSTEHSPSNEAERRRVEKAGGHFNETSGIFRIGGVSMTRALGDLEYKLPRINRLAGHNLSDLPGVETGLAPGKTATSDLVSNKADFVVRTLNGQSLVLLASDGVGDAKDAEEVTRLAVDRWQAGAGAGDIAKELTNREGKMKGADNCTVLLVVLDTEHKSRRSIDGGVGGRRSLDVSTDGSGSRRRRRSSIASLTNWMRDR